MTIGQSRRKNSSGTRTGAGALDRKWRISPKLVTAVILTLFFAIALFLRAYLPYDKVFTSVGVKFTSNDSYFFMRFVDNLVHNFPNYTEADPYHIYPLYTGRVVINFFVWLLSAISWVVGLGSPSQQIVDMVGAFLPAVLGALTVIPVYFIGKALFGRWAGVLSAGLIAILPGEFLGRSILGFTDNHVFEVLFTTVTMLFLILAIITAGQAQITLGHLKRRDWTTIKKPLIFSLLAALFMEIYFFTWFGALLFVFVTFVFFVIQFVIDHLKRKSTDYLCFVGIIFYAATLILFLVISYRYTSIASPGTARLVVDSLIVAILAILALNGTSRWLASRRLSPAYYPLALLGMAVIGGSLLYLINRSLFTAMLNAFSIFRPTGAGLTTIEMQPLISRAYGNPLAVAWGNFNVSFFLSFVSLLILIYLVVKRGNAEKSLLVVWSLIILVATLVQRRFGYYFAVNVALLTGYLCWKALELAGFKELSSSALESVQGAARRARPRRGSPTALNYVVMALAVLVIFFGVFFWNIEPAVIVGSNTPYAPSDAWVSSLTWLKENSPEPMDSPDAYYRVYKPLAPGEGSFKYPETAYGVLAWWDYGYWITRISHRIPNANPSQDAEANKAVASFFTSQNETAAGEVRQKLGSAYIVMDHETALSKFWAIATWAGKQPADYFDAYLLRQQNKVSQVLLYYPEYYRSLAARLYNFDGKAVTPQNTIVISYQESQDKKTGQLFKTLTGVQQFATYQEAQAFVSSQPSGNYKIVGTNPMKSPVPLEALESYKLVHSSEGTINVQDVGAVPLIKIFQYQR